MRAFLDSSYICRFVFLVTLFLTMLVAGFLIFRTYASRSARRTVPFDAACWLVMFILMCMSCGEHMHVEGDEPVRFLPNLPMGVLWGALAVIGLYFALSSAIYLHLDRNRLTHGSIKEALDNIPIAVCYFSSTGMVKLCNRQMNTLYRAMTQGDIQTRRDLGDAIESSVKTGRVSRVSGERPVYLFPDGKAWYYTEREITAQGRGYTESVFADVTDLYEKRRELERQSEELRELSRNIKQLSDSVLEMTREKEILSFKTRLHDEMGAGLVAARQSLVGDHGAEDIDAAIRLWRKAVRFIRYDNGLPETGDDYAEFARDAASIGVEVLLTGALTENSAAREVFLIALRECFTNGVRHAGATKIYAVTTEVDGMAVMTITNNGDVPKGDIVPGGGINNLRRHVSRCGGITEIRSQPVFALTVRIPVGKEKTI